MIILYRIILVDDEIATRKGLIAGIKWESLGLELCGEAKDGIEGLELARRVQPHVILTDVRMPHMNGIEMVTELQKELPKCKIIFMSGYTDKEYLKSAIHLKAVDYVEKPLSLTEISVSLSNAVDTCKEENVRKHNEDDLIKTSIKNIRILKNHLALELMNCKPDLKDIRSKYDLDLIGLNINDIYTSVIYKFNQLKLNGYKLKVDNYHRDKLSDIVEKCLDGSDIKYVFGFSQNGQLIIFLSSRTEQFNGLLISVIKEIKQNFENLFGEKTLITVGVGKVVRGIENTTASYQIAKNTLHKYFLQGYGNIFYFDDIKKFVEPVIDLKIYELVKNLEAEATLELLKSICEEWKNVKNINLRSIYVFLRNLIGRLSATMIDKGIKLEDESKEYELAFDEILNYYTLDEVIQFIYEKMSMFSRSGEEHKGKSRKIISAINYIKEHYNEEITLNMIADKIEVTPSYLCRLFKKETDKTVNGYIEEVRLQIAKELIRNYDMKLEEVAKRVGYNNANYFSIVFTKANGYYPSEYKRMEKR